MTSTCVSGRSCTFPGCRYGRPCNLCLRRSSALAVAVPECAGTPSTVADDITGRGDAPANLFADQRQPQGEAMSRKHNVRHDRSPSLYPERLTARGESSASVRMKFYDRAGKKHDTIDAANRAQGRDTSVPLAA